MIAIVVLTIVLMVFIGMIMTYKNNVVKIDPAIKSKLLSSRFTNIAECFAYKDPITGRVYPGMIDLKKFNKERLDEFCYYTDPDTGYRDYNFQLTLVSRGLSVKTNNYYNVQNLRETKVVLVKDGDEIQQETLLIETQVSIPFRPQN